MGFLFGLAPRDSELLSCVLLSFAGASCLKLMDKQLINNSQTVAMGFPRFPYVLDSKKLHSHRIAGFVQMCF